MRERRRDQVRALGAILVVAVAFALMLWAMAGGSQDPSCKVDDERVMGWILVGAATVLAVLYPLLRRAWPAEFQGVSVWIFGATCCAALGAFMLGIGYGVLFAGNGCFV